MRRTSTAIPDVWALEPAVLEDNRGFFFESYRYSFFAELGLDHAFVQDNHSSSHRGVLRGLHYQLEHPQAKLCRVIRGEVLDVAVDIRRGSPYFGKCVAKILSADNRLQLYLPAGFAHGFLVLSETAEFLYKCTDYHYPEDERGIAWNDPAIGIPWGTRNPILSERDKSHPFLSQLSDSDLPLYEPPAAG